MLRRYIIGLSLALFYLSSCHTSRQTNTGDDWDNDETITLEVNGVEVVATATDDPNDKVEDYGYQAPDYRKAEARIVDLIHTDLKIRFDWTKTEAYGKVSLLMQPYARALTSFEIDAVAMEIHSLELRIGDKKMPCTYAYNGQKITVTTATSLQARQPFTVLINYTARPEEVETEGSNAITDAKGLYFINADGKHPKKARQIWTQGETQSTSAWLPTIDAPNEKMTHDLFITVYDTLQTLSNGEFISSSFEENHLRTDHWKMEQPHAPYLVAMAIGKFYHEKAEWNDIPVGYFVDPAYENSARILFGNTPKMLSTFSQLLKYPYPWPKYDQVVVDDFVSGAMENTTLTIHGDMLKLDTRELLDEDYEDVIAHELFHHWFGDLVTCESWGQLPLNESFATYGEYLWREAQYGKEYADEHLNDWLQQYFVESYTKQVPLIRKEYDFAEQMFDAHSYQKGGLVLHMLRDYVGDSLFFEGPHLYLKKFAYGTAEIHNLRQCFEETSGEDLNWFFDQWFMKKGHPHLEVTHEWDEVGQFFTLRVHQLQDQKEFGVYRLPVWVEMHFGDSVYREQIEVNSTSMSYLWEGEIQPDWVSFDAGNVLLAKIQERKSEKEWLAQLRGSKHFKDRLNAIFYLNEEGEDMVLLEEACAIALADPYYRIKIEGMELMRRLAPDAISGFRPILKDLAENHPKSAVRAAVFSLYKYNPLSEISTTIEKGLNDSSYQVNGAALDLEYVLNPDHAVQVAKTWASLSNDALRYEALAVLSQSDGDYVAIFEKAWKEEYGSKFYLAAILSQYLKNLSDPVATTQLLNLINGFEPEADDDYFTVLFIAQINQNAEARWTTKKEELEKIYKNNPHPETARQIQEIDRLLASILHLF
ncbi:MAG: M1 family metallopeptidase [Bacteroidota bacterium]|nr:M1 family metallopeptidase [Bacteroidota bacterium]MDX5429671.1 M1 family metallopeptidase [Bacteroidota bacterium]MDX5468449.1 M1 family metallopeptidase [Bacteroidota bacterium]